MSEVGALKAVEVLLLLAGGGLFVWWQLRDVKKAQEQTRAERERRSEDEAEAGEDARPGPRA
jgi:uncharacterized protein HemX